MSWAFADFLYYISLWSSAELGVSGRLLGTWNTKQVIDGYTFEHVECGKTGWWLFTDTARPHGPVPGYMIPVRSDLQPALSTSLVE